MNAEPSDVQSWLAKAHSDLLSAQILIANDPAILDTACFHCQQAAEKALKAFLVFKGVQFEKVHNTSYLLDMCLSLNPEFAAVQDQAELLNPFAVEVRYPGDAAMPSPEEAVEALAATKAICSFVLAQLPDDVIPPSLQPS